MIFTPFSSRYARKNGAKGIRNRVLVIYTVKCSEFVARRICEETGHPDVEVLGFDGCTDNQYAVNLLISLIRHPNVGGVLAVGLGCEYVQPKWLAGIAEKEGKEADWMFIQDVGGTRKAIEKGLTSVRAMLERLKDTPRAEMGFSDLVIGAECGGSDYTSGLAGNVAVGRFYDKALDYCKSVRQYSVSPGNFAGGLSTIEEKSMGAVIKSGSRPIEGVIKVSCPAPRKGLWLLDSTPDPYWMQFGITNPNDNEGLMDLISCGAHIVFLVTGRGNVVGSAVSPCIKITGNHRTYVRMEEDMDFDASPVLEGLCSQDEMALRLGRMVAEVAGGKASKSEALGHREYFIPYKYQEKQVCFKACGQNA